MEKKICTVFKIAYILIWPLLLINEAIMFIYMGQMVVLKLILLSVFSLFSVYWIIMYRKNKYFPHLSDKLIIYSLIILMTICILFPTYIITYRSSKYETAQKHLRKHNYAMDILPETLPENISDLKFEYFPGLLVGGSYRHLTFTADSHTIDQIAEEAESQALLKLDYAEYKNTYNIDEIPAIKKYKESSDNIHNVMIATGTYDSYSDSGEIYVLGTGYGQNQPFSSSIIIDREKNLVYYAMDNLIS